MYPLLADYNYQCQKRIIELSRASIAFTAYQIIDESHELFVLFQKYKRDASLRKESLFGDGTYAQTIKDESRYNWNVFETLIFIPMCANRRLIPGRLIATESGEEDDKQDFVIDEGNYDHLQISMVKYNDYRLQFRRTLQTFTNSIIKSRINNGFIPLTQDESVQLICGSTSFLKYQYPGIAVICARIMTCLNNSTINEDNGQIRTDWCSWIPLRDKPNELLISSIHDEDGITNAVKSVLDDVNTSKVDTTIIKNSRGSDILGGITIIKDFLPKGIKESLLDLKFVQYPSTKRGKKNDNFIRVASYKNGLPLQYSKGNSVFFVLSEKIEAIEKQLLEKCDMVAFAVYKETKQRLNQTYGPKIAHEIIGDYIPYSSCLWSWRPAKTSGYGSHQDSTMLSSKKGQHYQEIVVTLVFHFDCSGESGAYLEITESGSDKIIKKFETLDLSSHVQHPGNQKNLFHSITSISSGSGGSRLVMTARRTGVPKPTTVIKDYFERKYPATHESELQERRKYQHQSHTLRKILSLHETNDLFQLFSNSQTSSTTTASIQHRRKRNTCQISSPKLSAPISKKQKGNSAKSSKIHTDIENSDGDIESDNDCDHSNVLTSIDTSNFYSYQPETNKKSNQATFIAHPASGIDFFLHEKSLSILFQKKIFIETVSAKSDLRITWSPMFHKNGLPVNIGDTININTYKTHHNIRESDIGGFISSNDIDTCTGYCLLHPERTLGYNEIMDLAANGKAQNFTFFGSGGAANVKGSNPSSISSVTCSAGGIFPRNQHFHNKTNECLNELSELERPIHFAMLVKDEKSGKKTEDVRYLGMYTIAGVTFGFPDIMGERMTRKNCDNIHGASFRKAKVFSYKAEPFDMGGLNNLGKYSEWKSIILDPNNVPYSFGILVQNITAGNVLRADCDEYDCNDVFEAMRTAPIGEIFDAQSVCEQIDRGDNSSN